MRIAARSVSCSVAGLVCAALFVTPGCGREQPDPAPSAEAAGADSASTDPIVIEARTHWEAGERLAEQITAHGYRALILETQFADGIEVPVFLRHVEIAGGAGSVMSYRAYTQRSEATGPPSIDVERFASEADRWAQRLEEFPENEYLVFQDGAWRIVGYNGERFSAARRAEIPEPRWTITSLAFKPGLSGPSRWIESTQIERVEPAESDGPAFLVRRDPSAGLAWDFPGGAKGTRQPEIKLAEQVIRVHFDADPPLLRACSISGDLTGTYEAWERSERLLRTQPFPGLGLSVPALIETSEEFGDAGNTSTETRRIRIVFLAG
ncbi:MAG: hypothetical protein AAGB51_11185 [Planctomycetota bacterium]